MDMNNCSHPENFYRNVQPTSSNNMNLRMDKVMNPKYNTKTLNRQRGVNTGTSSGNGQSGQRQGVSQSKSKSKRKKALEYDDQLRGKSRTSTTRNGIDGTSPGK